MVPEHAQVPQGAIYDGVEEVVVGLEVVALSPLRVFLSTIAKRATPGLYPAGRPL
jgi:hypothetical protein